MPVAQRFGRGLGYLILLSLALAELNQLFCKRVVWTRGGAVVSTSFRNPNTCAKPCYFRQEREPTQWTGFDLWTQSVAGTQ